MAVKKFERRPWGNYQVLHREAGIQVKRIEIHPHSQFSLQKHRKRAERWIVVAGKGAAIIGSKKIAVREGSFLDIPKSTIHRLRNTNSKKPLVFIEVQFGNYLGEDDIIRFADDFGRPVS